MLNLESKFLDIDIYGESNSKKSFISGNNLEVIGARHKKTSKVDIFEMISIKP